MLLRYICCAQAEPREVAGRDARSIARCAKKRARRDTMCLQTHSWAGRQLFILCERRLFQVTTKDVGRCQVKIGLCFQQFASEAISSEIIARLFCISIPPVYLQDGLVLDFQSMPPRTSCIHDSRPKVLYSNFSPGGPQPTH